jgi:gamma-glutamyl-gamma-aminobutyrate hydrolase PuuD
VRAAGGDPAVLDPSPGNAGTQLDALDGLILSGGADVDPACYGATRHPATGDVQPERDDFELRLARAAFARGLPTLGICRGVQVLNVAAGGTLIQHVPDAAGDAVTHALPERDPRRRGLIDGHVVEAAAGSRVAAIAGPRFVTGSRHHQAVGDVGDGLRVTARTPDGIVEALEAADPARFVLGVQWHPESTLDDDGGISRAIFAALVRAAREASG